MSVGGTDYVQIQNQYQVQLEVQKEDKIEEGESVLNVEEDEVVSKAC